MGSPYRRPLQTANQRTGTPLSSAAAIEDRRMRSIQSHQAAGNPRTSMLRRRLGQAIESKALAKSSLNTSAGPPRLWQHCTSSVA